MNILALELSHPCASICLADKGGTILFRSGWEAEHNHDSHLFPALQQAMDTLGDAPLAWILVGAGPGSYGGVRVALAAAVGLSTVTGARTVSVGSWDALSENQACVVSDARRGGWTIRRPNGAIQVVSPGELREELRQGTLVYSIESEERMQQEQLPVARCGLLPTAEGLVRTWLSLSPGEQEKRAARPAEPIYVRPPHITAPKHKPWEIRN